MLRGQGGAFSPAEGPFPTVDNGFENARCNFTRPQFCKQPPENLTVRLARAMRSSYGGRISLNIFGATCGSILRNPNLKKKWDAGGRKCAALARFFMKTREGLWSMFAEYISAE